MRTVRVGISDGAWTELREPSLLPGTVVVTGERSAPEEKRRRGLPAPEVYRCEVGSLDRPLSFQLKEFKEGVDLSRAKQALTYEQIDALHSLGRHPVQRKKMAVLPAARAARRWRAARCSRAPSSAAGRRWRCNAERTAI